MEMRIACLATDPGSPYGGREGGSVQLEELVEALAREGARVLALVPGVARDAVEPAAGATVEELPDAGGSELERGDWIEARLMRFGADALYERLALPSVAGSRAAARLGIPHLVDLDAPLVAEARWSQGLEELDGAARLEREVLARAERVLTVSSSLAMHALRCGARRVEVFPGAVAIERHPSRRRSGDRPVAVFAGRVRRWHGIETVAAAWRLLGEAAPVLVIAGDAGEASEELEEVGAVLLGPIPHRQVPAVLAGRTSAWRPTPATPRCTSRRSSCSSTWAPGSRRWPASCPPRTSWSRRTRRCSSRAETPRRWPPRSPSCPWTRRGGIGWGGRRGRWSPGPTPGATARAV
jgi:glycosyltransferase involved in cell wall biosynthesis